MGQRRYHKARSDEAAEELNFSELWEMFWSIETKMGKLHCYICTESILKGLKLMYSELWCITVLFSKFAYLLDILRILFCFMWFFYLHKSWLFELFFYIFRRASLVFLNRYLDSLQRGSSIIQDSNENKDFCYKFKFLIF